jgi:hypothetical protein
MRFLLAALALAACVPAPLFAVVPDAAAEDVAAAVDDVPAVDAGRPVCAPGAQVRCACVGGGDGAQVCADDGARLGPCVCSDTGVPVVDVAVVDVPRLDAAVDADAAVDVPPYSVPDGWFFEESPRCVRCGAGDDAACVCLDGGDFIYSCPAGMTGCQAQGCVSAETDSTNCGACGHRCDPGVQCQRGRCTP